MADAILTQRLTIAGAALGLLFLLGLLLVAGFALLVWVVDRYRRVDADAHDVGPDALLLLHDLDAHLDEYVAADAELAAGFDRLRQAIRDEQQKGDPTP